MTGVVVTTDRGRPVLESDVGVRWTLVGPVAEQLGALADVGNRLVVTGRSPATPDGAAAAGSRAELMVESVAENTDEGPGAQAPDPS